MKLIAETEAENHILRGLTTLLNDLGVDAEGYRQEEAVAMTFWSSDDFSMDLAAIKDASKEAKESFLCANEDRLRAAMIAAGYQVISEQLSKLRNCNLQETQRLYFS